MIYDIIKAVGKKRFNLMDEKSLQVEIAATFNLNNIPFIKEHELDSKNRPDFFLPQCGYAIEVKIKGSAGSIFNQCKRYASFESVKGVILMTNKSMGFPPEIFGKPAYIIKLGTSWL